MTVRKKIIWTAVLILLAAAAIVLCVSFFNRKPVKYDGTLVKAGYHILNFDSAA